MTLGQWLNDGFWLESDLTEAAAERPVCPVSDIQY